MRFIGLFVSLYLFSLQLVAQKPAYQIANTIDFNNLMIKSLNTKTGFPTNGILDWTADKFGYFWFVNQ